MSVLLITGTGTGVGKTITTAALASAARSAGLDVAVCKPVQTGTADGDDDLAEIGRLAGVQHLHGGWRYPEPLAPVAAAKRAGLPLPSRGELVDAIGAAGGPNRLTLVEGAGGLLVEIGDGVTLRDLAVEARASVLVVVGPELGTLNHTALTLEALASKGVSCAGLVIGQWPAQPGVAERDNRDVLNRLDRVRAVLPAGAGTLDVEDFAAMSASAFDSRWLMSVAG